MTFSSNAYVTVTLNPASVNSLRACSPFVPTNEARLNVSIPLLTTRSTMVSRFTLVPGAGFEEITNPCGTLSLKTSVISPTLSGDFAKRFAAASGVRLMRAGMVYRSAPLETTRFTVPPSAIESPANGSVEITRPFAISSSNRSSTVTVFKPRAVSVEFACSVVAPTTEGNFTEAPGPMRTHHVVIPSSTASPAAIQRLRRTRLLIFLRSLTCTVVSFAAADGSVSEIFSVI